MRRLCLLLAVALPLQSAPVAWGQSDTVPPPALSRVEVARFGIVAGLGGIAYLADNAVRDGALGEGVQGNRVFGAVTDFAYVYGEPGVVGLGAAMWLGGLVADRPTIAASGLRAIEAITVSGFVTLALKEVAGRARPDVAPNRRDDWQLLRGTRTEGGNYESMASGHATAAFAFAAAVTGEVALRAPEHARLVGITTYGLAAITALGRLHDDRHWLSDVTVGAGVGVVTGWAITRWHATRPDNPIDRLLLRPTAGASPDGSARVGVSILLR